jgi:SAM-dependent MidA family methyltransferase
MTAGPADDRSLTTRLTERIRDSGPLRVSEFVEAALYDSDAGFFMTGGGAGRSKDFLTAPEVGGLFGAVIARAIDAWWNELGRPDPLLVVDMGAGRGTLTRSVLVSEPVVLRHGALRWFAVERSPSQRSDHPDHPVVTSLDALPEITGPAIVIANELLDNLPFDVVEWTGQGWVEVRIGLGERGRFTTVPGGPVTPGLAGLDPPAGTRAPVQSQARRFVDEVISRVASGRLVAIDYGADTAVLIGRTGTGWIRVHRDHDNRGSWLDDPGSRDITADVAVDQITADHPATRVSTQAEFLRAHGIEQLVEEGRQEWRHRAHVGDLDALRARSRVSEAEALLDPAGMGSFFVAEWVL